MEDLRKVGDIVLKERVLSAVIGVILLILIFKVGGLVFLGLNIIVVGLGLNEYFRLVEAKGVKTDKTMGIIIGISLIILIYFQINNLNFIFGSLFLILILILLKQIFVKMDGSVILVTAVTFFGVLYIVGLFSHLVLLYNLKSVGEYGYLIVWLPIIATWLTDTGAYFTGINFGKHPLAPNISPKKTIEGAIGGAFCSIVFSIIMSNYLGFGYWHGILLGLLIAIFGQLGDLVESLLKRDAQIKDSGTIIPGHGGILDRIDSLLFSLPIVYYYLQLVVF